METSSQMAENNFNFLYNIPICIKDEELLLTALENGDADADHGKTETSQKTFACTQLLSGEFT